MSDPLHRAERCRDLAEGCRRLAQNTLSAQMRNRYSLMADHYSALAEAEEIDAVAYGHLPPRRWLRKSEVHSVGYHDEPLSNAVAERRDPAWILR